MLYTQNSEIYAETCRIVLTKIRRQIKMRNLATIVFLIAAARVTLGNTPEEAFHSFLTVINCNSTTNAGPELLFAYNKCNAHAEMEDVTCLFPCIANELGLIVGGKSMDNAVSEYVLNQFKDIDPVERKNWTERIKTCFNQYESRGGIFPTEYKNCYQKTNALMNLSTCVLLTRDCGGHIDRHRNTMLVKKRNKRQMGALVGRAGVQMPAKGIWIAAGIVAALPIIGLSATAIVNSQRCGKFGCYKGYCYAYCGLSIKGGDWCYTTKTFSQSFDYVKCKNATECDKCWKCAGSCTVGW